MAQVRGLIRADLPLFYRCLTVPAEWQEDGRVLRLHVREKVLRLINQGNHPPIEYDPWEMRDRFFSLKQGDTRALLKFLNVVGIFQSTRNHRSTVREAVIRLAGEDLTHRVRYESECQYEPKKLTWWFWNARELLMRDLKARRGISRSEFEAEPEFAVRIERSERQPRAVLTTMTFMDAALLTLTVDAVLRAKVRKCARPDCPVVFSFTSNHKKKYHDQYCGHLESVRRERRGVRNGRSKRKT
jgi:hypothetical protein